MFFTSRTLLTGRSSLLRLRLYAASWVRDIGPDLRPNDYKKKQNDNDDHERNASSRNDEPSMLKDLAVVARGGMETLRPALLPLYMTHASAYRDALKSFIQGYQEGVKSIMDRNKDTNLKMQDNVLRKDT